MRPRLFWLVAVGFMVGVAALWNIPKISLARATALNLSAAFSRNASLEKPASFGLAPAIFATTPSCYTWDFLNNTGQDATGLVIHLKGISSITDVYTGVLNPFGAPDSSSGYNSTTGVYSLIFGSGTAPDSAVVQIGICTDQAALRLDTTQPAFYWVVSGSPTAPHPLFAGLDFNWIDPNHLQVHLYNEQSISLTTFAFSVLLPSAPLSLDDLNDGVVSTLPMASDQVSDPLVLEGGTSATFDIFFNEGGVQIPSGAPIVLEAVLSTQDDLGNPIHLVAQTSQPFSVIYMPKLDK